MTGTRSLVGWAILSLWASAALGHALSPSLLALQEADAGRTEVLWKTPLARLPGVELAPVLPETCRTLEPPATTWDEASLVTRWTVDCGGAGLAGSALTIANLADGKTDVLVRLELRDGRRVHGVLNAKRTTFVVPERQPWRSVFHDYFTLGVEHILLGFDHLLFVLGLLLLVRGRRRLAATITAFTAGHSVTLSLVALGFVAFAPAPVEAAIAGSIFVLAVEIARPERGRETWMRRFPWTVAGAFGLLHGLGFAGALAEAGLPGDDVPLALFSFNAGIEIGQLLFVAAVLVAVRAARGVLVRLPAWCHLVPVYVLGSLAAFWTCERLAGFL